MFTSVDEADPGKKIRGGFVFARVWEMATGPIQNVNNQIRSKAIQVANGRKSGDGIGWKSGDQVVGGTRAKVQR